MVTATGVVNVTSGGTTGMLAPGTINITGNFYAPIQALLNITSGVAGFGTAGVVSGQVNVIGDAEIEFASGQMRQSRPGPV